MTLSPATDARPLAAISSRSLAEEVAVRLREAIVTGVFGPEQHLRETDLAALFEVSRSPVRDALVQLDHEGLVQLRRHRGAIVVGLSVADIDELHSLRVSLERLAIRLAVARATPADVAALRQGADRVRAAAATEPARAVAERDVQFHDQVYRLAGHQRLYACWAMIQPQVYRFLLSRHIVNDDYRVIAAVEHHELCDTIAAGDESGATAMITAHLEEAYQRLRDEYARTPAGGSARTEIGAGAGAVGARRGPARGSTLGPDRHGPRQITRSA
ncbi:MAG TPA: GntR family transcriptional regulator [Verrucomicrobiae bacterium]|nr:GntR family transcriptional regulator [Verrucomicrobiae bacterium]